MGGTRLRMMFSKCNITVEHYPNAHQAVHFIVQELCESRGGRPGLSVLTSLLVSVDVKRY